MSGNYRYFKENSVEYTALTSLNSKNSTFDDKVECKNAQINNLQALKLKNPIISLGGSLFSLIFMIIAIILYKGPHLWHFLSYLGGIKESSTEARTFFGFSLLSLGVTMRYFFKGMKDVSDLLKENPIINFFGEFAGVGFIGIALFELHTQGIIHNLSTITAGICVGGSIIYYSNRLWRANNYSRKMISLLIIGGIVVPFILISGIWIAENVFKLSPEILAFMQKSGFLSLMISIWIQDIYILRYHKKIRERTTRLNIIHQFEKLEGEYSLIKNYERNLTRKRRESNNDKMIQPLTIQVSIQ